MAGDANMGGGGSVKWSVNVDNVDNDPLETGCEDGNPGHHRQKGRDKDGVPGTDAFTISIKVPGTKTQAQFLTDLQGADLSEAGRIKFPLPIEKNTPDQIRIRWGNRDVTPFAKKSQGHASLMAAKPVGSGRKRQPKKKAKAKASSKKRKASPRRGKSR
jgi:hypothetical protein